MATAQSFHRRAVVIDLNTGFEFYNTTLNYKIDDPNFVRDTIISGEAGNTNFALGVEVGLGKHFGVGVRGKANRFVSDIDAVTQSRVDARSTDLMLTINIHPVVRNKFDLILGSEIGLSGFNFNVNDVENTVIKGTGSFFTVYLNPRIYFGRFGINLKAYVPFTTYNDLDASNKSADDFFIDKWKGNGIGASIGIQLRLN
jgi:hypothetical protein